MNRLNFLKILGVSALTPSVLVLDSANGIVNEMPVTKFKPKNWPIYPDKIQLSFKEGQYMAYASFAYVKITRNNSEFLIPVKETCLGDEKLNNARFEWSVKDVQDKFVVDETNQMRFDKGFIIKYDPQIHKN